MSSRNQTQLLEKISKRDPFGRTLFRTSRPKSTLASARQAGYFLVNKKEPPASNVAPKIQFQGQMILLKK
ncbi:MAG: hypothetical protein HYT76_07975 [Deltaproteobacteria bacterium]|nr:hypothetical protein [Deltaproteobacteria bacterium]